VSNDPVSSPPRPPEAPRAPARCSLWPLELRMKPCAQSCRSVCYSDELQELVPVAVEGTRNVINAAAGEGVRRVVFTCPPLLILCFYPLLPSRTHPRLRRNTHTHRTSTAAPR
jgi:hypothetical protein